MRPHSESTSVNGSGLDFDCMDSNPANQGRLRKDLDSIRSNDNAIGLNLDWRWAGCYGEIAVRCL